jgi:DNA polymerase beta
MTTFYNPISSSSNNSSMFLIQTNQNKSPVNSVMFTVQTNNKPQINSPMFTVQTNNKPQINSPMFIVNPQTTSSMFIVQTNNKSKDEITPKQNSVSILPTSNNFASIFSPTEKFIPKPFIQSQPPALFNQVQLPVKMTSPISMQLYTQQQQFQQQPPLFNFQPQPPQPQQQTIFNIIEPSSSQVSQSLPYFNIQPNQNIDPNWGSTTYIADLLEELAEQMSNDGEGYRATALQNASKLIKKFNSTLTSENQLKNIRGIGEGSLKRVKEIIQTGKLSEIKHQSEEQIEKKKILEDFMRVHGVGKVHAEEWYNKGFRSLDRVYASGIATSAQMSSMKYLKEIELKIPREEITQIRDKIQGVINEFNIAYGTKIHMEVAGSYRRLKAESGDIDILIREDTGHPVSQYMSTLIDELKRRGIILETLGFGPIKYLGIGRLDENHPARRIDIEMVDDLTSWYPALVYFTGSKENNTKMRQEALNLGFESLNEKGLFWGPNMKVTINSEEELYKKLKMSYLKPEER